MNGINLGGRDQKVSIFVLLLGFLSLYLPVYIQAWNSIWQTEENGHGPVVLAVLLWLWWTHFPKLRDHPQNDNYIVPIPIFIMGLTFYAFGRSFGIGSLEFFSQILVISSLVLLSRGISGIKIVWFPILYFLFLIPLPATLIDIVTQPLKNWISILVVEGLAIVGYPIGRTGVVISIGQYQLLVADACSGLHSMFSLSALGVLYMYMMARPTRIHNVLMLISIIPLAFFANIIRVVALVLVTYHFGDDVAQGVLHDTLGFALMATALILFFTMDAILNMSLNRGGILLRNKS